MMSEEQKKIKLKRILFTVQSFLESDCRNLEELSKEIGIPSSSIQRYLKEKQVIEEYFGSEIYEIIRERLAFNKTEGLSKGGINFVNFNISTKDETGKFTGSRRR
ncbi:MAG: hypothetical protein HFH46_03870 [Bacilli bacterium]|nr:hypothetical protein [Bacilli bacterium]